MNVVKCKRRIPFILNTGTLLVSTSHIIVNRCITICLTTLVFMILKNRFCLIKFLIHVPLQNAAIDLCTNCGDCPPDIPQFFVYCQYLKA